MPYHPPNIVEQLILQERIEVAYQNPNPTPNLTSNLTSNSKGNHTMAKKSSSISSASSSTAPIADVRQHIEDKVREIVKMDAAKSRSYDTAMGWAFFRIFTG